MTRAFDLEGLFRERPLGVLSAGPFFVPGSVSPSDQVEVVHLLQRHGAPHALRRVEVDVPYGLIGSGRRMLEHLVASRRQGEHLLVIRDAPAAEMRALADDPLVRVCPWVALVVTQAGDEPLGPWGELLRAVREAVQVELSERAAVMGIPEGLLDMWQPLLLQLANPCEYLRVVNDLVAFHYESPAGEGALQRRSVRRGLAWRSSCEVVTLIALATDRRSAAAKILGEEALTAGVAALEAQHLWHPDDGLRDWAALLSEREYWRDLFGADRELPTPGQRADGWDDAHDEFCTVSSFSWLEETPVERRTPFLDEVERALETFDDRSISENEVVVERLQRRAVAEATSSDAQWRYLWLCSKLALGKKLFSEAAEYLGEALEAAEATPVSAFVQKLLHVERARSIAGLMGSQMEIRFKPSSESPEKEQELADVLGNYLGLRSPPGAQG